MVAAALPTHALAQKATDIADCAALLSAEYAFATEFGASTRPSGNYVANTDMADALRERVALYAALAQKEGMSQTEFDAHLSKRRHKYEIMVHDYRVRGLSFRQKMTHVWSRCRKVRTKYGLTEMTF